MDIEKLHKEDFKRPFCGEATIRFQTTGPIILNSRAIKHLSLREGDGKLSPVCIYTENKRHSEFFITRDDDGWELRLDSTGKGLFNNVKLARFVIDSTWENCVCHPVGCTKPDNMTFKIARLPLDDDKNKNVFALLRKKE
jgi:hypothetical protein